MTNEHMTQTERAIRKAFPEMSDPQVQNLRLLSVLKRAVDTELAEGAPADSKGVKQVFMNMEEIVDAHVCTIAYYMGLSSMADNFETVVSMSLEIAAKLVKEIQGARAAYKELLANGNEVDFSVIDENLMGQSSDAKN